ncbi:MAG: nuclear transport factor 2 family protein [Pseudomonadota bacterium]
MAFAGRDAQDDDLRRHVPDGAALEREAPTPPALERTIAARSAVLFDAIFARCDPDAVSATIAPDFEFHHDRWGTIASSGPAFVERIRAQCLRRGNGEDPGSRRELVPGTQRVFPIGDDAALETGVHRFHVPDGNDGDTLVGIARYSHLWRRTDDGWVVARILSYEHMAVH